MAFITDFESAGEQYIWEENNNSATKEKYLCLIKVPTVPLQMQLGGLLSWDSMREVFYFKGPVETSTKTLSVH